MKPASTAALALLASAMALPAAAQSMGSSMMMKPSGDWSGAYVGILAGAVNKIEDDGERLLFDRDFDGQFDDTVVLNGTTNNAFSPGSCGGRPNGTAPTAGCVESDVSGEFAVRAGYDMQFGNWVVGVVGEYSGSDAEDSVTSFSTTPASYTFSRSLESVMAVRGRLGWAMDRSLAYVTAGVARGEIENSFTTSNRVNSFTTRTDDDEADGFQAGAGVEYKLFGNVTVVGEYLYTSLEAGDHVIRIGPGTAAATNPFILPPNTAGTDTIRSNPDFETHAVRVGLNMRF